MELKKFLGSLLCVENHKELRVQRVIIGKGMKTFPKTLGGYETLWRIFEKYKIL